MTHFGIISPPVSGHLHPLSALGRELQARGHRATCFQVRDVEEKIRALGIDFCPIGESDYPPGSLPQSLAQLGRLKGLAALRFTIGAVAQTSSMVCRDAPAAIRRAGIDVLLVDQMEPAGGAVAEHLGLPFITVCNALALNRDPVIPPPFTGWSYREAGWAKLRNGIGYAASDWLMSPVSKAVGEYRMKWKLPPIHSPDESYSKLAQICQMPREFDFPRTQLPAGFHYVGPLRRPLPEQVPFPWERLDGRPLVYASLGTLQNNREDLFRCIAEACRGLDVQVVLNHVGGLSPQEAANLPQDCVVVSYAPQVELLAHAKLTITHAGLNTVLDSLIHGVPMVAIPITYEQPAISRRVEWTGSGRSVPLAALNVKLLRAAVSDVLHESKYGESARRIGESIHEAGGVRRGADLVEGAANR
jgi:zeaxanthin glucosyltransferase